MEKKDGFTVGQRVFFPYMNVLATIKAFHGNKAEIEYNHYGSIVNQKVPTLALLEP